MKLSPDRSKELTLPAERWYYATKPRESDREVLLTREQYQILRDYEPTMYRQSYEEYVVGFGKRQQEFAECAYIARSVSVTRYTVDEVYTNVTSLPDFSGWLVE